MTDTEVHQVNVVLRAGSPEWFWGHYIVKDDVLTMTDKDGRPVAGPKGETYSQKLDGESAHLIAARMTRKIRLALEGQGKPGTVAGFNRKLVYPKIGIA